MKASEIFEGENSGLRKAFDEAVARGETYTEKRLELFDEKFGDEHNGIGSNKNIIKTGQSMDELKAFLTESIAQAKQEVIKHVVAKCAERFHPYCSGDKEGDINCFDKLVTVIKE